MKQLKDKIVLITGASSGIGAACARRFAEEGAQVILTARRLDRINQLADVLRQEQGVNVLPIKLDVQDAQMVKDVIAQLPASWRSIDILVNNAGLGLTTDNIQDADTRNWDIMIDTNLKGLLYLTHAIVPGMIERGTGHIINIGSIGGHEYYPGGNVYCATKHAVKAITKTLLIDLLGTPVRVSSVDPGAVETEFSEVRWRDKERARRFYADFQPLHGEDIADTVIYCASRPPHVTVAEIIVLPTDQASANHLTRGNQEQSSGVFGE